MVPFFWKRWFANNRRHLPSQRARSSTGQWAGATEALEQKLCLSGQELFAQVYQDITGDGYTDDDLPVAGWSFEVREIFIDEFPDIDDEGNFIVGERYYVQTANLTTNAQGMIFYTTSEFTDPTPRDEFGNGYGFRRGDLFALHNMSETPEFRAYFEAGPVSSSFNNYMLNENRLHIDFAGVGATQDEIDQLRFNEVYVQRRVYLPVMVSGVFYEDWNGDGIYQDREPVMPNRLVSEGYLRDLFGGSEYAHDNVYSDETGSFTFEVAPRPNYLYFSMEPIWGVPWQTPTAGSQAVNWTSGQIVEEFNLGGFNPYTASGFVYEDKDGSGTVDSGDVGYTGNLIYSYNGETTEVPISQSLAKYSYLVDTPPLFANPAAQPTVRLAGDLEGVFVPGPNNTLIPASDYVLAMERTILRADRLPALAYFYLVTLEGRKYRDTNANGEYDPGVDVFLPNARITLDLNGDGSVDMTTETDSLGRYRFEGVRPGNHRIRQILEPGETPSGTGGLDYIPVQVISGESQSNLNLGSVEGRDLTVEVAYREDNKEVYYEYVTSQIGLPFEMRLYRSTDSTWDLNDEPLSNVLVIDPTEDGETGSGVLEFTEDYVHDTNKPYVFIVVDPLNKIQEDVEGNNVKLVERKFDVAPYAFWGEFEYDPVTDRMVATTGEIQVGFEPVPGQPFIPLINVSGNFAYDTDTFHAEGTVDAYHELLRDTLFTGVWKYNYKENKSTSIVSNVPADHLGIAGQEFEFHTLTLVNPGEGSTLDSAVDIQGLMYLPLSLTEEWDYERIEVVIGGNNKIRYSLSGRSFTGAVAFPDVKFKLLQMDFEATGLSIEYQGGPLNRLLIRGALKISGIYGDLEVEANFNEENYIAISRAGVDVVGALKVSDFVIVKDKFEIKELVLTLNTLEESISGVGEVLIPVLSPGMTVVGGLGFRFGQLDMISIGVDHLNLPGFSPGWFVQKIQGTVSNMTQSDPINLTFSGTVGMTFGPEFELDLDLLEIIEEGDPENEDADPVTGAFFRIDVTGTVNLKSAALTGQFSVLAPELLQGNGGFSIQFSETVNLVQELRDILKFSGGINLLEGILVGTAGLTIDGIKGTANGVMNGALKLPDEVPEVIEEYFPLILKPLLGKTLASGQGYLVFTHDDNLANDYIMASATLDIALLRRRYHLGFKVAFDGTTTFLHNMVEIQAVVPPPESALLPAGMAFGALPATGPQAQYNVAANTDQMLLTATWENDVGPVGVEVVAPDGTVYSASALDPELIAIVEELSDSTRVTFAILEPSAGLWTIRIPDADGLGTVSFQAYGILPAPTITLTGSTRNGDDVTLNYVAEDPDSDAVISFYYDTDGAGFDGVLIAENITEQDGPGSYVWNTSDLPAGTYYVYAMIQDGQNGLVYASLDTPIIIDQQAPSIVDRDFTFNDSGLNTIVLHFSEDMTGTSALDADNYVLRGWGNDGRPNTGDDVLQAVTVSYDAEHFRVIVQPQSLGLPSGPGALFSDVLYSLTLTGITDAGGQALEGNTDTAGEYVLVVGYGRSMGYRDVDGDTYSISLSGSGLFIFVADDPQADGTGAIEELRFLGADSASSVVTISTKAAGGDGFVDLHSATGAGLKSFTASTTDVVGSGLEFSGFVGTITLHDILAGADLVAGGTASQQTTFKALSIGADSDLMFGSSLKTFTVARFGAGSLQAAGIGALSVTGDKKQGLIGNMEADVTLTGGSGALPLKKVNITGQISDAEWEITGDLGKVTVRGGAAHWDLAVTGSISLLSTPQWLEGSLTAKTVKSLKIAGDWTADITLTGTGEAMGSAKIGGQVRNSQIVSTGSIGLFSASALIGSQIYVGFAPTDPEESLLVGDFATTSRIAKLTIGSKKGGGPALDNSVIAASTLGKVTIGQIDTLNAGTEFGIAIETSINSLSIANPSFKQSNITDSLFTGADFGDFLVLKA